MTDALPQEASSGQIAPQHQRPKIRYRPWFRKLIEINYIREDFRDYCTRAASGAKTRSKKNGLPYDIDGAYLEQLLIEGKYRCAISGLKLELPAFAQADRAHFQNAFGPSLDRIIPAKGYVRGNVRITCTIINTAMNEWGEEALYKLVDAMKDRPHKNGAVGSVPR